MALNTLPTELKLQIFEYTDRVALKSLRLLDKFHHSIATPALFGTVHIRPTALSFKRANKLAGNKDLAKHVTRLVYHVGKLSGSYTSSNEHFRSDLTGSFHRGLLPRDNKPISEDYLQQKWKNYLEEIRAQQDFEVLDEMIQLKLLLLKLPFLDSVVALLDEYHPFEKLDGYIEQRTGMPTQIDDTPHTDRLLRLIPILALRSLELGVLGWGFFLQNVDMAGQLLSSGQHYFPKYLADRTITPWNLQNLHLGLYNSEYFRYQDVFGVGPTALGNFLLNFSLNVSSLSLDFDELPFKIWQKSLFPKLMKISDAIFMHTWPSLVRLSLRGIIAKEDDLVHFLSRHAPTLKDLSLGDVEIANQVNFNAQDPYPPNHFAITNSAPSSPGSVISLFYRLHASRLRLHRCSLHGVFTNRFTEAFYASPHPTITNPATAARTDDTGLRARFEAFLCHASASPYPRWPTYHVLHGPIYDLKAQAGMEQALRAELEEAQSVPVRAEWCDGSWEWCPDLLLT